MYGIEPDSRYVKADLDKGIVIFHSAYARREISGLHRRRYHYPEGKV